MVLKRIKQYLIHKGISISAFERSIGMSNASFGKSLKNNRSIGVDKLENILRIYPDINPTWILTGEGNMLREGKSDVQQKVGKGTNFLQNGNNNLNHITIKGEAYTENGVMEKINGLEAKIQSLISTINEKDKLIAEKERLLQEKDKLLALKDEIITMLKDRP